MSSASLAGAAACGAALVLAAGLAAAQVPAAEPAPAPATPALARSAPLWELGLGLGAVSLPHYRGAGQSRQWLLPFPYAVYRGEIFQADRDGARAVLVGAKDFSLDLSLAASAPVRAGANAARAGMPGLPGSLGLGPKAEWVLARSGQAELSLRAPLLGLLSLQRSARLLGWQFAPVLNLDAPLPFADVGLQAGPIWQDARLNQHLYGVDDAHATPQRPAYTARAGFAGWQTTLATSRRSGDWWWGAYLRADGLDQAAFRSSPLVQQRHSVSAGFALAWVFARSATQVPFRPR